jgi:endonuclease/exonuclease/phosphatase family metal-dependent hydrolase
VHEEGIGVRVGTWNLENLFTPGHEAGPATQTQFDAKANSLAATITTMDPDVLAVQEVGDPQALQAVMDRVGGHWHIETAAPDGRGIRVGLVSKTQLSDVSQIDGYPAGMQAIQVDDSATLASSMGRPALHAVVHPEGQPVHLLTCHLKSKLLTFPGGRFSPQDEHERARFAAFALFRRTAEATTVRTAATEILTKDPQARLVLLGDFNDTVQAQTTQILNGPPGSEIGTPGFSRPDSGDRQRLWNLAPRIPPEQRYSRIYRGRAELIDHILLSHALVHSVAEGAVTTDAATSVIPSITDAPGNRRGAPGSDHRPVLAVISA